MARGKVTTSNEWKKKVDKANQRADSVLTKVGGLRAHIVQNNPSLKDVIRILDSIIQDS